MKRLIYVLKTFDLYAHKMSEIPILVLLLENYFPHHGTTVFMFLLLLKNPIINRRL